MSNTETQNNLVVPSLTLPLDMKDSEGKMIKDIEAFKLFASISSTDDNGIIIDNVKKGDEIIIYDASGIASFRMSSMKLVKAVVGIANAIGTKALVYATDGAALPFTKAWNKALSSIGEAIDDGKIKHSRRDAYGCDPGSDDYAKNEGGLIVCMPKSKGAIYATDSYHLTGDTKNKGRREEYYSKKTKEKNAFFPCPEKGCRMSGIAEESGAAHILSFDDKFTDNCGAYTVGILVIRKHRPSGKSRNVIIDDIKSTPVSL